MGAVSRTAGRSGSDRTATHPIGFRRAVPLAALAASALCLLTAPASVGGSYSWVEHTTSESAAQGVHGAWLARLGFVLFGIGVAAVAAGASRRWRQPATAAHLVFAASMLGVAAFSTRPWSTGASYDATEDLLHSVFASVMGVAFAFGVGAVAHRRWTVGESLRFLDAVGLAATIVLPTAMTVSDGGAGIAQRAMFAVAYAWYGREAFISGPGGRRRRLDRAGHR